jgi:hypothetical protein
MGRALDRTTAVRGVRRDLKALGVLALSGAEQLELLEKLHTMMPTPPQEFISADSAARGTASIYSANVRVVEALAKEYGFTPIYVWQPTLHSTSKPLTPFEARLMQQIKSDPFHARLREVHLAVPALLDSIMPRVAHGRFVNAATLFSGDTTHIYVDWVGHNSEEAIPVIVDSFWPLLRAEVQKRLARMLAAARSAATVVNE